MSGSDDPTTETPRSTSPSPDNEQDDTLSLTIHYHSHPIALTFPPTATITDLSTTIAADLSVPPENQKFLIAPKTGLLRPPFKDPTLALSSLTSKKITLMGSTTQEVTDIATAISSIQSRQAARTAALRQGRKVQANRSVDWKKASEEATYTFATIKPLPYLPDPAKSLRFLERLAADPGIKASMRKHKFSVGMLTEMNPAEHTTHESRTLGLNRNRGEVIELRLWTDDFQGYRDYRVIRKTLCHELAHNVWGEHDRNFWNLCREIEGEVEKGDWTRGGHSLGGEEFYNPNDEGMDEEADGGGWTGGEYVLGARAAEERMKKQNKAAKAAEKDGAAGPSSGN
ncbi:hypothetical protein H2203_009045 [Taxawa tesnikishii (nom. ined.)]|nr:hypothetical protein H2203_009045 [Dothideales sp. JES 119]